ncbi:MAG: hypothetical protein EBX95_12310 [Acidimicrobiia bacterium]|nr:hypothetical protein [Acidimicrobiia bacterium]
MYKSVEYKGSWNRSIISDPYEFRIHDTGAKRYDFWARNPGYIFPNIYINRKVLIFISKIDIDFANNYCFTNNKKALSYGIGYCE